MPECLASRALRPNPHMQADRPERGGEEPWKQAVRLRNEMEAGPGGRQIQVEDPDGNPVELFEPAGR